MTDVPGLLVGHAQDTHGLTGVTVVLAREGATIGVDVRGSAPGTRETALMDQAMLVQRAFAVMLAGGSAFGLAAADGVMTFCEQHGMGLRTGAAIVPIVPAAVIYDLEYGTSIRPNAGMGYAACVNASQTVQQGSIGAGIGATVGKVLGMKHCQKGGIGTASMRLGGSQTVIGALMCVNAFGDVIDDGRIVAGASRHGKFVDTSDYLIRKRVAVSAFEDRNTTIGIIATNAQLSRSAATKLAQIGQDGLARSIRPVHTMVDGDTIFGLSYGREEADLNRLLAAGAEAARRAVLNAIAAVTGA